MAMILRPGSFEHYVEFFNEIDDEPIRNLIGNEACWDWMHEHIPWFECPDQDIERIYYFRWWVFRKHLKQTPVGVVITKFLPDVGHARRYNTIACAACLHIDEARWLRNRRYVSDYIRFWFSPEGEPRRYSTWFAHAVHAFCIATADFSLGESLLEALVDNYRSWEKSNQHESGLFWSHDTYDGGEYSISGDGLRPTLNSYMYGDAVAISTLASKCGRPDVCTEFAEKAARLKAHVQAKLWDSTAEFFKSFPLDSREQPVDDWAFSSVPNERNVRELYGFLPWKFSLPDPGYERAWLQLVDEEGFAAPYGPTTAEQRHPRFMKYRFKRCQWDGPSWPFTTSLTIAALAELLHNYEQNVVGKKEFFDLFRTYARSQHRILPYGDRIPWIGENLHPHTGIWLAHAISLEAKSPLVKTRPVVTDKNHAVVRGKDYNHSSYCDLIISGLVGFRPEGNGDFTVAPLLPEGAWDWFCLDGVEYGGAAVTILYDRTGKRYGLRPGMHVYADDREIGHVQGLSPIRGNVRRPVADRAIANFELTAGGIGLHSG